MTTHMYPRLWGTAVVVAPVLLILSTISYIMVGEGMNVGEAGGAIQVWAMIAFAPTTVSLARLLETPAPRAAAALTVLGLIGAAGGVGYGIDSIQAAVFDTGSIQETDSAAFRRRPALPALPHPDVEELAVVGDTLLLIALLPLGWRMIRGEVAEHAGPDRPSTRMQAASATR